MFEEQRAEEAKLLRTHDRLPNAETRALDFGCGSGSGLEWLCKLGGIAANFYGVDIRSEAVELAAARYPHLTFLRAGEAKLPFTSASFDCIQAHLVLSSILDNRRRAEVCAELDRILRSGGALVIYDFRVNSPWNPNVRGIERREFRALFPNYRFIFRSLTVIPPFTRKLGRFCRALYPALRTLPFLRTHNLGLGLKTRNYESLKEGPK
jgi:SAM-dependent methyltransferase